MTLDLHQSGNRKDSPMRKSLQVPNLADNATAIATTPGQKVRLHMRPSANLCTLVGCLVASRIELNAEPSDQGGGFGAKDTGHFG